MKGTGVASPELLPGTRLVRAFNAINAESLADEAHRKPPLVGIPPPRAPRDHIAWVERGRPFEIDRNGPAWRAVC